MNDGDLSNAGLGSIAMALGKFEAQAKQTEKQLDKLFDIAGDTNQGLGKIREEIAKSHASMAATIRYHGDQLSDLGPRVEMLEAAQQQRAGASKLGAAIGHGASAAGGGLIVWALQNIQRAFGH